MRMQPGYRQSRNGGAQTAMLVVAVVLLVAALIGLALILAYVLFSEPRQPASRAINDSLPRNLNYGSVEELYDYLRQNFDGELNEQALLDGIKKGLLEATGDPHSVYFTPQQAIEFEQQLLNKLIGIGAYLIEGEGYPAIMTPLDGSPAERAGIKAKDLIVRIDNQNAAGLTAADAANLIRGEEGTEVQLTIRREGAEEDLQFTIVREVVNIPSVEHEIQEDIGIIKIRSFSPDLEEGEQTVETAVVAAETLLEAGVRGVVLDLRFNPGGALEATQGVGGLWLEPGEIVASYGPSDGELIKLPAEGAGRPPLAGIPLVILVNEASASAAEIVAAALQDHGIGTVVGTTTFGKSSVQNIISLSGASGAKITTAHWYTPHGRQVEGGIKPDVEVDDDLETELDEQLEKALQILQRSG
ncbi:S41 family peptidase [Candidatus Saccharibacteria bacterium]|nr:S41 family peptidase [Candidatus Saccharibacteria bacterium]